MEESNSMWLSRMPSWRNTGQRNRGLPSDRPKTSSVFIVALVTLNASHCPTIQPVVTVCWGQNAAHWRRFIPSSCCLCSERASGSKTASTGFPKLKLQVPITLLQPPCAVHFEWAV